MLALSLLCICLASQVLRAQTLPQVGAPAPELTLRTILGATDGTHGTWQELKGKAVVIEFWATWCGFCVDSIPHLNELAEKFKLRPVQFISVTDETDVDLVKSFLKEHGIAGWVAFDDNEATFDKFGVAGRPETILVDAAGIVRGIVKPEQVTSETLEGLVGGKDLSFAPTPAPPVLGLEPHAPPPLFQVLVRPAAPQAVSEVSPGWKSNDNGRFSGYGLTMLQILSQVYRVPQSRVEAPQWCGKSMYDVSVVLPQGNHAPSWPLVKQALETAFGLKIHAETRKTQVYVLRKIPGLRPALKPDTRNSAMELNEGQLESTGYGIEGLTRTVRLVLASEVLDETGLKGGYDFNLKWDAKQPHSIVRAIREQLNLDVAKEDRRLKHLVVDSIDEPKTR